MAKRYSVVTSDDHGKFVDEVAYALNSGWELQGGVSMCTTPGGYVNYAQAVQRTDETKFFPDER